jgi:hypothetical protein
MCSYYLYAVTSCSPGASVKRFPAFSTNGIHSLHTPSLCFLHFILQLVFFFFTIFPFLLAGCADAGECGAHSVRLPPGPKVPPRSPARVSQGAGCRSRAPWFESFCRHFLGVSGVGHFPCGGLLSFERGFLGRIFALPVRLHTLTHSHSHLHLHPLV